MPLRSPRDTGISTPQPPTTMNRPWARPSPPGIPRGALSLTTKGNPDQGYRSTLAAYDRSLCALGTDYVDLYLIHWPHDPKYFDNWQEVNLETARV